MDKYEMCLNCSAPSDSCGVCSETSACEAKEAPKTDDTQTKLKAPIKYSTKHTRRRNRRFF